MSTPKKKWSMSCCVALKTESIPFLHINTFECMWHERNKTHIHVDKKLNEKESTKLWSKGRKKRKKTHTWEHEKCIEKANLRSKCNV